MLARKRKKLIACSSYARGCPAEASQILNNRGFRRGTFSQAELGGELGDHPLYHPVAKYPVPGATTRAIAW